MAQDSLAIQDSQVEPPKSMDLVAPSEVKQAFKRIKLDGIAAVVGDYVILESDIEKLEYWMDVMDEGLPPLTAFILPGGHAISAHTHVARCICRRAERMAVTLDELEGVEALVLTYLNRLSDYLFVLSRKFSLDKGVQEHTWTPRH